MAPQVVQYPRATSLTAHSSRTTGVEGARGPGYGARGRWRGLAGLRDGASPPSTAGAAGVEGAGGSGGHGRASRSTTPSEARVWRSRGRAAAHRRNRPDQVGRLRGMEGGARSAGSGCGACGRRRVLAGPLPATRGRREACGVWLWCLWAAAGPGAVLLAAMRGRREACGAWPGFETTRRAKLAARTASGRAGPAAAGD